MKRRLNIQNVVLSGLFASMIFVVTAYFPRIPTTRGYIHIGDSVIYIAACLLNQPSVAIAAGLGGFLADALTGYIIWAPYTALIKAALTVSFTVNSAKMLCRRNFLAAAAAFPITIGGYYAAAWIMTGSGTAPLAEVPFNAIQAAASMVIFLIAAGCMDRTGLKNRVTARSRGDGR